MALGFFRKIGNFFKKVGQGIAKGVKWTAQHVLTVPAKVYKATIHKVADKIPIIRDIDGVATRVADTTLGLAEGNMGKVKDAWTKGDVINDIKKVGSAIAGGGGGKK